MVGVFKKGHGREITVETSMIIHEEQRVLYYNLSVLKAL